MAFIGLRYNIQPWGADALMSMLLIRSGPLSHNSGDAVLILPAEEWDRNESTEEKFNQAYAHILKTWSSIKPLHN